MKNLFPDNLICKAKFYFHTVFNDGDRIRVFFTGWQYETETVFYSAAELKNFISNYEQELMDEFDFMAPRELQELGILF